MADIEDVNLVLRGELDATFCDLTDAILQNLDLRGRDFASSSFVRTNFAGSDLSLSSFADVSFNHTIFADTVLEGVEFGGSLYGLNFDGARLKNAVFTGLITDCSWVGADLRGTDFSRSTFSTVDNLEGARINKHTIFVGAQMPRALSRHPIFQSYSFERGRLVKGGEGEESSENESEGDQEPEPQEDRKGRRRIFSKIRSSPREIQEMAGSLSAMLRDRLESLPIPNEPTQLDRHLELVDILKDIETGLSDISEMLSSFDDGASEPKEIDGAVSRITRLRHTLDDWLDRRQGEIVDYGSSVVMLGGGSAFLSLCGAPSTLAFPTLAFLLGGERLARTVTDKSKD